MMRRIASLALIACLALSGCAEVIQTAPPQRAAPQPSPPREVTRAQVEQFIAVTRRVEPVAERTCRERAPRSNCDFRILVDDRPGRQINAYQTLDDNGRPLIVFTLPMIAAVRNADELAFVMGHEAAHHIEGHIPRQQQSAAAGALLLGGLTALTGAGQSAIDSAVDIGAGVGGRVFSKEFELEADALGTVIAHRAGHDPLRGVAFFSQIPDPGNRFLGTHPPNAQRVEVVRRTAARL
jgi:predicted Zn-dependent protease